MSIVFDFDDFNRMAADLIDAPKDASKNVVKAFQVTAHKVRDGWADRVKGSPGLEQLESALSYDVDANTVFGSDVIRAEIGFDKSRTQGPLGNISEFGSLYHPPRGFGLAALKEQQADFEKGLGIAIGDIL